MNIRFHYELRKGQGLVRSTFIISSIPERNSLNLVSLPKKKKKKNVCTWRIWIKPQFTYSRWGYKQLTRATCWLIFGAQPLGCFLAHWGSYLYWAQWVLILPKTMLNNSKVWQETTKRGQASSRPLAPTLIHPQTRSAHLEKPLSLNLQDIFSLFLKEEAVFGAGLTDNLEMHLSKDSFSTRQCNIPDSLGLMFKMLSYLFLL